MHKVVISNRANEDIMEIHKYIFYNNESVADKVVAQFYETISYFEIFPHMGKERGEFREFVEQKYKFRIIYKVEEIKKIIIIISIFKNKNTF